MEADLSQCYSEKHTFFLNNGSSCLIHNFISTHPDCLHIEQLLSLAVHTSTQLAISAKLHIFSTPSQLSVLPMYQLYWPKANVYLYKEDTCKNLPNINSTSFETMHKYIVAHLL